MEIKVGHLIIVILYIVWFAVYWKGEKHAKDAIVFLLGSLSGFILGLMQ